MRKANIAVALISLINFFPAMAARPEWTYRDRLQGESLCVDLLTRLNRFAVGAHHAECSFGAIASSPKLAEPKWESLDGPAHLDLIARLLRYQDLRGLETDLPMTTAETQVYLTKASQFLNDGGRVQVVRPDISDIYDNQSVLLASPVVLRLQLGWIRNAPPPSCTHRSRLKWEGPIFFVSPDLSGPDTSVPPTRSNLLLGTTLMFYKGNPVFVSAEDVMTVRHVDGVGSICGFIYRK